VKEIIDAKGWHYRQTNAGDTQKGSAEEVGLSSDKSVAFEVWHERVE